MITTIDLMSFILFLAFILGAWALGYHMGSTKREMTDLQRDSKREKGE